MKSALPIIFAILVLPLASHAQETKAKVALKAQLGLKYTPIEYHGGPSIGTVMLFPSGMNISLRKDFLIGMGTRDKGLSYIVTYYRTYNYLDFGYTLLNNKLIIGGGLGWIYNGEGKSYFLNSESGYYSFTAYAVVPIDAFHFELRCDIPLGENQQVLDQGYLFPVSMCLAYRFPGRKRNEDI